MVKHPRDKKGLNIRQRQFINIYLKNFNAGDAYKGAGYTGTSDPNTLGNSILNSASVHKELNRLLDERVARTEVTVENILAEIAYLAFQKEKIRDGDKLKALELLGKKFGLWDGGSRGAEGRDRESGVGRFLRAVRCHSGGGSK